MAAAEISPNALPFVGRESELTNLREGLRQAQQGGGSAWAVLGPGGMGKTRLLRALEQEAARRGIRVRWGYCLKESVSPFFPFEQIFRRAAAEGAATAAADPGSSATPPSATLLYEEERPKRVFAQAAQLGAGRPLLVISRDRSSALRQKQPDLPANATLLWLSRTEGPESVSPGQLDALGERIETFLRDQPGAVVALTGLEYLISQNSFLPVLRLIQVLRDATESGEGKLLLAVHAATLEDRERSLLEAEAEVIKEAPASAASSPGVPAPDHELPAHRLLRYLELLQQESRTAPQLLLLDDLQWADAQSRTAFQFLARNARDLPVMLVAALREESDAEHAVPGEASVLEMLDHLDQEGVLRPVRLAGLPQGDASRLVASLVGAPLDLEGSDQAFLDILERTGGNPYFFLESLQQLVELGYLRKDGNRAVLALPTVDRATERERSIPLPPSIRRLVARRLEALDAKDRAFLDAAAVAGSEFDLPPLCELLGQSEEQLVEVARRLERRHRLLSATARTGRWEFAHPLVWEVLREELPAPSEHRIAGRLATWWERERPRDVEGVVRLYYHAHDRDGTLRWAPKAIERALDARAFDAALRYVRWRQELLTASAADVKLRAVAEIPIVTRMYQEGGGAVARYIATELVALPLDPPLRWEARIAYANAMFEVDPALTNRTLAELDAELQSAGSVDASPDLMGRVLLGRSAYAINTGAYAEGEALGVRGTKLPQEALTADTRIMLWITYGWCLKELKRMPESLELLQRAGEHIQEARSAETRIRFYNAQGATFFHVGNIRGAKDVIAKAVETAHARGNVNLEVLYRGNFANTCWILGEYEESLQTCEAGISLAAKFQFERGCAQIWRIQGAVLRDQGKFGPAEEVLRRAREFYQRTNQPYYLYEVDLALAVLLGQQGDVPGALRAIEALEPLGRSIGGSNYANYFFDHARLLVMAGRAEEALKDLDEAPKLTDAYEGPVDKGHLVLMRADAERARGHAAEAAKLHDEGRSLLRSAGVRQYRGLVIDDSAPPPAL